MQRFAALTISLGVIAVVAVGAAQTPDIAACDGYQYANPRKS